MVTHATTASAAMGRERRRGKRKEWKKGKQKKEKGGEGKEKGRERKKKEELKGINLIYLSRRSIYHFAY